MPAYSQCVDLSNNRNEGAMLESDCANTPYGIAQSPEQQAQFAAGPLDDEDDDHHESDETGAEFGA